MGRNVSEETNVTVRSARRFVREGAFAAEVNVELVNPTAAGRPTCPWTDDAYKLDNVRDALREGDLERASRLATRIYRLTPVDA